ncbi:MAG: N-acetylmuramoyl-L-alanine amidase [Pseudomonadota bacterium]
MANPPSWIIALVAISMCVLMAQANARTSDSPLDQNASNTVSAILISGDNEGVRLVFDMETFVTLEAGIRDAPYRMVIDLPQSRIDLSSDGVRGEPGVIDAIRFGHLDDGRARLVLSTEKPILLKRSFTIARSEGRGVRLVVDLEVVDEQAFHGALAKKTAHVQPQTDETSGREAASQSDEKTSLETARAEKGDRLSARLPRIVIDPGHGGIDGGATAVGRPDIIEKTVVLDFAKKLRAALAETGQFEIKMTRYGDDFLRLSERVTIASKFQADLFVSIHADSLPQHPEVRGATVYTLSARASNALARVLAEQENQSEFIGGYTLKDAPEAVIDILADLSQRDTAIKSDRFAQHLISSLKSQIRFFKRPHQTGAFKVLKAPEIPSALIELGYLSNKHDVAQIESEAWRSQTAEVMAKTIAQFLAPRLTRIGGQP